MKMQQIPDILQNLSISAVKPPEVEIKQKRNKDSIEIVTHLKEIYGKNNVDYIINSKEPIYEEMKIKFKNIYNNDEPTFYVRIPYLKVLIGDNITEIFKDKILTTIDKDFIICGRETEEFQLTIEQFDEYYPKINFNFEDLFNLNDNQEKDYFEKNLIFNNDFVKYSYFGMKFANELIKPKKNKGLNVLICNNFLEDKKNKILQKLKVINFFTSIYLSCFYIHGFLEKISKKNLFDFYFNHLSKLNNFENEYAYVYSMFFLEQNNIGISYDKYFIQFNVTSKTKILHFESLTPLPPLIYSEVNYWNKRKIEYRLALAIILKKINKQMSFEDLIKICTNFNEVINYFDKNMETIKKMIQFNLKETPYKINEIKEELDVNLNSLLSDIGNSQYILAYSKEFNLMKRFKFIINEYERILNIYNAINSLKGKTNEYFHSSILPLIKESSSELNTFYDCYSQEINLLVSNIENVSKDVFSRISSSGWGGEMIVIGEEKDISEVNKFLINHYEYINSKDECLANMWLVDDLSKYCDYGNIGGMLAIMNPEYEDFMH